MNVLLIMMKQWGKNRARKEKQIEKLHGPTEIAMHTLIECTKTMFKT